MNIAERLRADYGLAQIDDVQDVSASGPCFLVTAGDQKFILKHTQRRDFVTVYDRAQRLLTDDGFTQARVLPNCHGELMSPDGYSLFEYIPGETPEVYSSAQFEAIVRYLRSYNRSLRSVPFAPDDLDVLNVWDKVKLTAFQIEAAAVVASQTGLGEAHSGLLLRAREALRASAGRLDSLPKQLIHADLGPGNAVFADGVVRAVIDFTPDYENELYSLSQFLYWTCLWGSPTSESLDRIRLCPSLYFGVDADEPTAAELLSIYLIKACLFRLLGPALSMIDAGAFEPARLTRRFAPLETALALFEGAALKQT